MGKGARPRAYCQGQCPSARGRGRGKQTDGKYSCQRSHMLAACGHTSVPLGWHRPQEKSQRSRHQKRDEGVSAECAGKRSAHEGRRGRGAFPWLLGGGVPRPHGHSTHQPLPPEATSARLSVTWTQIFPSSLKYQRARVVVLQLLERLLLSRQAARAPPRMDVGNSVCITRKPRRQRIAGALTPPPPRGWCDSQATTQISRGLQDAHTPCWAFCGREGGPRHQALSFPKIAKCLFPLSSS